MAVSKNTYTSTELNWAEEQLISWKTYIDEHPLHTMVDRIEWRQTKTGAMPMVVASIEAQGKFIQETMKNYLALLEEVERLREKDDIKKVARGNDEVPPRMQ
jgi:hypothetical protein